MSKTPVSELNARMNLDIAPLEQAVPRASALLKRLSVVQAEALASQSGGPDIQAMTERLRAVQKSPGIVGTESGGTARFKTLEAEKSFVAEIAAAHEESLRRRAAREAAMQATQKNAIAEVRAAEEQLAAKKAEHLEMAQQAALREQEAVQRRLAAAATLNEFETQRQGLASKSARDSAAVFIAEERAAAERLSAEQEIVDLRRRQQQVRSASEFDRANPFKQQVMAVEELNRLLGVRRNLQRGTVEFAKAELAVTQQIARVRAIRDNLTVGTESFTRLGNTAADSQKGFARFGLAMQQVGYQVQDFSVQVASGTNALVAFSQQSSQLLGFFGGFAGALAGAAISTGILAFRLATTNSGLKDSAKLAEEAAQAWTKYSEVSRKALFNSSNAQAQENTLKKELGRAKSSLSDLFDLQSRYGRIATEDLALYYRDVAVTIKDSYQRFVFPTLEQQLKYEKAVAKARAAGRGAPSPLLDEFGGGAIDLLANPISGPAALERLISQIDAAAGEGATNVAELTERLKGLRDQIDQAASEKAQREDQALADYETRVQEAIRANRRFGENSFETLNRLRDEWKDLLGPGPQDPLKIEELRGQILQAESTVAQLAETYKDQLDPLRAQRREMELIQNLQNENLLTAEEAFLLQLRMADQRDRQLKLPDAFRMTTGSSTAGLRNTDGSADRLISVNQQMLAELRKLVWQGSN